MAWTLAAVSVLLGFLFALGIPGVEVGAETDPFPLNRESLAGALQRDDWDESAPVDIRSDRMNVDFHRRQIVFRGAVRVTQSDFSLTADEVTAVFGDTAEDVRRIEAQGDVRIRKGERVAGGREVIYDRVGATVVLRGDPYLEQGRNFIRGEEIRAFLHNDRVEIVGGVSAEFRVKTPESEPVDAGSGSRTDP